MNSRMTGLAVTLGAAGLALVCAVVVVCCQLQRSGPSAGPLSQEQVQTARGPVTEAQDYTLSKPYTHDNLTVFLIHGPETLQGRTPLTLQEALGRRQAVVHETGGADLTVENLSDRPLFIQSGDIVKGGQQDRVVRYDQVVSPGSGRVALSAFCVEQNRCGPRGTEPLAAFALATEQLPGRQLKLAALHQQNQAAVWQGVQQTQANLAQNVGRPVQAPLSPSSLQLTLESHPLQQSIQRYLGTLADLPELQTDVIGYAVVVNGKLQSADVYASRALFRKVWPKLLRASAVEAIAEGRPREQITPPTREEVTRALAAAEKGQASRQRGRGRIDLIVHESAGAVLLDACDREQGGVVIHRGIITR
jgi:hypothetical protein